MKTSRIWSMLASLLAASAALAQDASPPPAPPSSGQPGENIVVHLQGKFQSLPIDVKYVQDTYMAGDKVGSARFAQMDATGANPIMYSVATAVSATPNGYAVKFDLGVDLPFSVSGAAGAITYRAANANTTVLMHPGQSVDIFNSGDTLAATIEKLPPPMPSADLPTMDSNGQLSANLLAVIKITNADGKVHSLSTIVGGTGKAHYASVLAMKDINGIPQPIIGNLDLQLRPEPGGLGVSIAFGQAVPVLLSAANNLRPGTVTNTIVYRNVSTMCDVLVGKLAEPVTLYSSGKESITLMLSRVDK